MLTSSLKKYTVDGKSVEMVIIIIVKDFRWLTKFSYSLISNHVHCIFSNGNVGVRRLVHALLDLLSLEQA